MTRMNCPVCKTVVLSESALEPGLPAHPCGGCGGQWVRGEHYYQWLERQPGDEPGGEAQAAGPVRESSRAKLCPECGRFLTRYGVGHGIDFCIDRCGMCGGVWLDANEWLVLKAHHLHTAVHQVFSAAWQAEVKHQEQQRRMDQLMTEKLGAADYAELRRIKEWIDGHARRSELYAYLLNPHEAGEQG